MPDSLGGVDILVNPTKMHFTESVERIMARMRRGGKPTSLLKELGSLVREIRLNAGESIKAAAPRLEVDYTYLSKIENGLVNPSSDLLSRIAEHYGVQRDALYLAAGRLPPDIERIIQQHPQEVMVLLRNSFGPHDVSAE